jgi:hypothetical protein
MNETTKGHQVLTFTVKEETKYHKSAGETASWYYEVLVSAGVYEARCTTLGGDETDLENAYWVTATLHGTCVNGWLPGYKCNGAEKEFGKPMDNRVQTYGFMVRDSIAKGEGPWQVQELGTVK